ncbi:hypothetical protein [Streptomyces paromomycinus]|uniref:hypothetical protein n=1 Tax=Streptomyces paromomycinus TaxID=92743 RepID=UPI000F61977E|nr:hypothetical protein [Streptomyces paromomycinus]
MNKRTRLSAVAVSALTALAVGATGVSQAYAVSSGADRSAVQAGQVTQAQIDELTRYLEALDRGEHLDADGNFDYEATKDKLGGELADALKPYFDKASDAQREGVQRSYASCLLDAIGLGGIGGLADKINEHIKKKNWRKVAEIGLKEAAKRGVKIAVKGGVAGMAAVLAGASIYCIWKGAPERPAGQAELTGFAPVSFAGRDAASFALAG